MKIINPPRQTTPNNVHINNFELQGLPNFENK